jgi:tetratricopeptide (TPR) repeat protein
MASGPLVAETSKKRLDGMLTVRLETEKDKAKAARYQPNALPTIVYLSPRGVIVDRTEGFVEEDDFVKHLDALADKAKKADEELEKLEGAAKQAPNDLSALEAVGLFWEKHQNWAEAVPVLQDLVKKAGEQEFPIEQRHKRWTELVRGLVILLQFDDAVKSAESLAKHALAAKKLDMVQMAELLIGFSREQQGKPDEAIKAYERAVSVKPDSPLGKKAAALRDKLKEDR